MLNPRSSMFVHITGFVLMLLLLMVLVVVPLRTISTTSNNLHAILDQQEEAHNIFTMRDSAHKRALMLFRMAAIEDEFELQDISVQFMQQAQDFILARDRLLARMKSKESLDWWEQTRPLIARGSRVQGETMRLIMDGDIERARHILLTEVIPTQDAVMANLTQVLEKRRQQMSGDLLLTSDNADSPYKTIAIVGTLALLLGISIAWYVTRHNLRTESGLMAQREIALRASKAKSEFLANMSHEIRTPLTAILGFAEALREPHSPAEQQELVGTILRNGVHLQQIINDILDLSKIEAGQLTVEDIEVDLPSLLRELESIMSLRAREKGLAFEVEQRFPLPRQIRSDPTRLKQILINLCGNAIKFTERGEIKVSVSLDAEHRNLMFAVSDTGIGMTEAEQERIFKPFCQADTSTTRRYGGTGLGLSISKQLAEHLGGTMTCQSHKGEGSCFTVTLTAGQLTEADLMHEAQAPAPAQAEPASAPQRRVRGRILLAEDNPDNQRLISMHLRKLGADCTIAENGRQAVEAALNGDYDLILMDMQMPEMDGVEATTRLREAGYSRPIVSLTANAMQSDRERCFAAGANDYLVKPIDPVRFKTVVGSYLQARQESIAQAA